MITFQAKLPRKGIRTVTITSDPIWSPALRLWFVWTTSAAWSEPRPWHLNDLPGEVSQRLNQKAVS